MTVEQINDLTAGQLLRQTREQKQLSVQQVAIQLNLKPELILKIEQDEQDTGTLATFSRGYIKAYARLLKIPEQQVLSVFEKQSGVQSATAKPMSTFSNRTGKQTTEKRFVWLTYAIVLLLIAMLFAWWWQTGRTTAENITPLPAIVAESTTEPVSEPVIIPTESVNSVSEREQQTVALDNKTDTAALTQNNASVTASSVQPMTEVTQLLSELVPQTSAEPETAADTESETLAEVSQDTLKMTFRDSCWIDVVDAQGNRVAYGTKQKDYVMTVNGVAPFVITLGNPSVVDIDINQQSHDMSAFPAGRAAKFTLSRPQ